MSSRFYEHLYSFAYVEYGIRSGDSLFLGDGHAIDTTRYIAHVMVESGEPSDHGPFPSRVIDELAPVAQEASRRHQIFQTCEAIFALHLLHHSLPHIQLGND